MSGVRLHEIAERVGTPVYVYNAEVIRARYQALDEALGALPHSICYAIKANSNLSVLRLLRDLGAGADIVSGGEMLRALAAGFEPDRIVFSGVGKTTAELTAAVKAGIGHVHLESVEEMEELGAIAARRRRSVKVGIRVNPEVTASTHPYIATGQGGIKFGVPYDQVVALAIAHPVARNGSSWTPSPCTSAASCWTRRPTPKGSGGCCHWSRRSARPASRRSHRWTSAAGSASATATKCRSIPDGWRR